MSAPPATATDVVRQLSQLTERLYQHVRSYADAEREAVTLRAAADLAESRAYLTATGSVEARKHEARVAAAELEERALVAEAVVRTLKAKIRAIETDIDVHRSFGASIRAELRTLDYQDAS